MRIRRKKWARPELEQCSYYIENSDEMCGKWHDAEAVPFGDASRPLYLEIGCGKGIFAAQHALRYPDINIIAADIKADMLGVARRNIEHMFGAVNKSHDNVVLLRINAAMIEKSFSETDTVDRIYLNFSNPWNRGKHNKRRLTHPRQLVQYKRFLSPNGSIHFKTDDDELFEDSVQYFADEGFKLSYITRDLHASDYPDNLITEHERLFVNEGKKIKFLIAEKKS